MNTPQVSENQTILQALLSRTHVCDSCNTMQGGEFHKLGTPLLPSCVACSTPVPLRLMDEDEVGNRALDRWLKLTHSPPTTIAD